MRRMHGLDDQMEEPTNLSTEKSYRGADRIERFDSAERFVHWATAFLMLVCIGSVVAIQIPAAMVFFGGRTGLRIVHIISGTMLPIPLIMGFIGFKKSKFLKADLRILGRFTKEDFRWIRYWGNNENLVLKKFNGGQKANYAFMNGAVVVMMISGFVMQSFTVLPLSYRIGATFTHKLFAWLIVIVIIGHIGYALTNFDSLKSMITLKVSRKWAEIHCRDWVEDHDNAKATEI